MAQFLTVWKFPLRGVRTTVEMPEGAQALAVREQAGLPCLWALVDPDAPKRDRTFLVVGTGHPLVPSEAKFVGSFFPEDALFAFHVFELPRVESEG